MATITPINRSSPNDGLGDSLYTAAGKINDNFANLNSDKSEKQIEVQGLMLLSASWTYNDPYWEYALAHALISSDTAVDVIPDDDDIDEVKSSEILPRTVSSSGSVKIKAVNQPVTNIGVTLILRESVVYQTTTTTTSA